MREAQLMARAVGDELPCCGCHFFRVWGLFDVSHWGREPYAWLFECNYCGAVTDEGSFWRRVPFRLEARP